MRWALLLLVGCTARDDLAHALGGTTPENPPVLLTDGQVVDGRVIDAMKPPPDAQPPRDAQLVDAQRPVDAGLPPVDAAPPPLDRDLPPPDAALTCDQQGLPCTVGVGICEARGQIFCENEEVRCNATPGQPGAEQCDGLDNDCDDRIDEGVANACGDCGPVPVEVCNGLDDNCNGVADEGLLNACGGCGPVPLEVCDRLDDDCDGRIDEGSCRAWVLLPRNAGWIAPPGLNRPLADGRVVDAAATFFNDSIEIWAFIGDRVHIYLLEEDRWAGDFALGALVDMGPVDTAEAVPRWWRLRTEDDATGDSLLLTQGDRFTTLEVNPFTRQGHVLEIGNVFESWGRDPMAPEQAPETVVLDLRNARDFWNGRPRLVCPEGAAELGPTTAVLADGRLHLQDVGRCFRFVNTIEVGQWDGFELQNAPDPNRITAWTHVEPEQEGNGVEVIFLRP